MSPDCEQLAGLGVVVLRIASVDVGRLGGHRRVEVERQERDLAALDQAVELPDHLLGAADGERRDEQHALGLVDHADGLGEDPDRLVLRLVFAATVRALDEDVVRGGQDGRVAQDRRPGSTQIAGAHDDPLLATLHFLDAQPDDGRPQDVARVEERRPDPGRHRDLLVVVECAEPLERPLSVLDRVQGCVEVDLDRRRLRAQLGLGVARPAAVHGGPWRRRLHRGRDVRTGLDGRRRPGLEGRRRAALARLGQGDRGLVGVLLLAVLGRGLIRVASLPAGLALGELLM